ncbi:MAG: winged helix-turn-helix transcriptional regulator [Rhodospirillales bacterium]|jgi:MarR family transcriptional regulator, lower aerobic nicotinate degradation pathway regulator|nr:winged helix-turn-helix transcriptional regulator [Rhodospirillales bacterium]
MDDKPAKDYILDDQIGFILRQVYQRHSIIFSETINENLTPTQFATLAKLLELGASSQNHLGRLTAMDAATIKGVVDRLVKRDLMFTSKDPSDARRLIVDLTGKGRAVAIEAVANAARITKKSLDPLDAQEQAMLLKLLKKMC